jgi:RHS repeat-associated protein
LCEIIRYNVNARLLTTTLYNSAGATLDAAQYGYNVGNQRTTFTNAAGTHVGYTYDSIGQLKVSASSVSSENRGYAYDAAWNVSNVTNNGVNSTFSLNNLNELSTVGTTNFLYDGNGNLTNWWYKTLRSTNSITNIFDDENRLIWVSAEAGLAEQIATSFVYDGLGRLREQLQWTNNGGSGGQSPLPTNGWTVVGGIAYVYDGNRVIQERDLNNNPLVAYTRGNDLSGTLEGAGGIGGLLARSDGYSSGNFSDHNFYHADGNGNITYLVNSAQTLAASYRYDPFGNLTASSGSLAATNTYRFSSKEFIPSVGLYYYLYRFYGSGLQRWMNRDPLADKGFRKYRRGLNGAVDEAQLFTYVRNVPIGVVDPHGLSVWSCTRTTSGPPFNGYGRHAYLWDDRSPIAPGNHSCGLESGYGYGATSGPTDIGPVGSADGPLYPGGPWHGMTGEADPPECYEVPGSEGNENAIMAHCRSCVNNQANIPGYYDCHDACERVLGDQGYTAPPNRDLNFGEADLRPRAPFPGWNW